MKRFGRTWAVLFLGASLGVPTQAGFQEPEKAREKIDREPTVVFVCEHGVAKSVIAAAYFNRLAREQNLAMRAIARGTAPEAEIPPSVAAGLRADGLAPGEHGQKLAEDDVSRSRRVVAFCKLPEKYYKETTVEEWDDVPPVSEDYSKARDAIVEHVKRLLAELEKK